MDAASSLVVGGTSGLGLELAESWLAAGSSVSVAGRQPPRCGARPGLHFHPVDLASTSSVEEFCRSIRAAASSISRLVFTQRCRQPQSIEHEIQVSVLATARIIEALAPCLDAKSGAKVLIVSSTAARKISERQGVGYHISKAAVLQVARFYAWQLGPSNVSVNVLCPSYFLKAHQSEAPTELRRLENLGTLPGYLRSREVIAWIDTLTDRRSDSMTGQVIELDRGAGLLDPESRRLQTDHLT